MAQTDRGKGCLWWLSLTVSCVGGTEFFILCHPFHHLVREVVFSRRCRWVSVLPPPHRRLTAEGPSDSVSLAGTSGLGGSLWPSVPWSVGPEPQQPALETLGRVTLSGLFPPAQLPSIPSSWVCWKTSGRSPGARQGRGLKESKECTVAGAWILYLPVGGDFCPTACKYAVKTVVNR